MGQVKREGYQGTGPGEFTPDGCAVEVYERLPVGEEPEIIAAAVSAGARILELGSGAGRMTHPLVERGFAVTAVDESAGMLAVINGARTVCASIGDLELDERFDVVLLASFLVHTSEPAERQRLLAACRRHVAEDGCVLIQREAEDRHENLPVERPSGDGLIRVASSEPAGDGVRSVHVEYEFPDGRWTQTFLSRPLTPAAFEQALRDAGLTLDTYLTPDHTWARALPA